MKSKFTKNPLGYYYQGDVEELVEVLREYLSYDSTDGRKQRQPLRNKLKDMIDFDKGVC